MAKSVDFAARLRAAIDKSGRPVTDIATSAGLSRQAVYQLLAGQRTDPPWSTVCRLADALGVSVTRFR